MANIPLIRGLTSLGKHIQGRMDEKRQLEQKLNLDALREQAWQKRLQEQTVQQERLKQYMLQQERIRQEGNVIQEGIRQESLNKRAEELLKYQQSKWDQEKVLREKEIGVKQSEVNRKRMNTGKQGTAPKEEDDEAKRLKELQSVRKLYEPQYQNGMELPNTGNPKMLAMIDDEIKRLTMKRYGFQEQSNTIQGNTPEELLQNYYQQLIKGGFSPEEAFKMTQTRFGGQQQMQQQAPPMGQQMPQQAQQNNDPLGIR